MATPNDIANGMIIIAHYAKTGEFDDTSIRAGLDQIWCGEYTGEKMTKTSLDELEKLGWFEDEDAWSILV